MPRKLEDCAVPTIPLTKQQKEAVLGLIERLKRSIGFVDSNHLPAMLITDGDARIMLDLAEKTIYGLCPKCFHRKASEKEHRCPADLDFAGDEERTCSCCPKCTMAVC